MAKILVIEDDADLQQILSHLFFRHGFEAHHAFNGKEGYDKILSIRPDIILLDLMLPVISGADLLKMILDNVMLKDIPVIVMTGYGDETNILERSIKAQGAREYIRKPFEPSRLIRLVKSTLERSPKDRSASPRQFAKGVVRLDSGYRSLWVHDRMVATLTPKEAGVVRLLLESKGAVPRERILREVWGPDGNDNVLYKTVQRIREQLGEKEGRRLQTHPESYEFIGDYSDPA